EQRAEVLSLAQGAREKLQEAGLLQARILLELRTANVLQGRGAKYLRDQFVYTAVAETPHEGTKEAFRDHLRLKWRKFDEGLRSQLVKAWRHTLGATGSKASSSTSGPTMTPRRLFCDAPAFLSTEPQWLEGLLTEREETPETEPEYEKLLNAAASLIQQTAEDHRQELTDLAPGSCDKLQEVGLELARVLRDLKLAKSSRAWRPVMGASWARSPVQVHFPCDQIGVAMRASGLD
ncbi:hypothetical protein EBZ37_14775, partial [bacterium]|nr:hypothetical protein [bacterium]